LGPKRLIGFSPPKKRKEKIKKEKEGKRKKERKKAWALSDMVTKDLTN